MSDRDEVLARARYAASRHNSIGWSTVKALLEIIDEQAEELERLQEQLSVVRNQRDTAEEKLFDANQRIDNAAEEFRNMWNEVQA
jgi:dynactin complex subunit